MRLGSLLLFLGLLLGACDDHAGGPGGSGGAPTADAGRGDLDARPGPDADRQPLDGDTRPDRAASDSGSPDGERPHRDGGASLPDRDGDGVPDGTDNCPDRMNPDQDDRDGDHAGDACDPEPEQFGHRLAGQALLFFGGFALDRNHSMTGSGSSGAHRATSPRHRLTGRLSP